MTKTLQVVSIGLASLLMRGACTAQQIQVDKNNRTIAITTNDTAKAIADVARIHIGYTAYAMDAKAAYAKASGLSNAIIAALKKAGVSDAAIQSDSQSISEQPNQSNTLTTDERAEHRYLASQSWTVVSTARAAGETLNVAVNAGANNSGDMNWSVADEEALQALASAHALQRARQIAEQMAKGLNSTIGSLIYASNEAPPPPNFALPNSGYGQGVGGGMAGGVLDDKMLPPLIIIPQTVTKSATVYAVFALQ